jgi:deoxyribonuclease-4
LKRYFGCHVSSSGGLEQALINGDALGVNSIQLHPSPPQKWNSKPYPKGFEDNYLECKKTSKVEKVFFHAIYLINLANPDPQKFQLSKLSLVHYLDLCARIGGDGVIVHVGSLKDQEDESLGLRQVAEGIKWVLSESPANSNLLLEVAAGSGKIIGAKLEQLESITAMVGADDRLGYALDTQHLWASGYNLVDELESLVSSIDKHFGLSRVKVCHINDSMVALNSRKDRHQNLGEGMIGGPAMARFINHPALAKIPMILETPNLKDMETAAKEIDIFRRVIDSGNWVA